MPSVRRLSAIFAADVAGYSRLIGADESGTLQGLKAVRAELVDPKIAEHRGRIVKTTGDGLLVEFGSVVDALCCASEVRMRMAERNGALPPARRIEFRIGVHQDIVVEVTASMSPLALKAWRNPAEFVYRRVRASSIPVFALPKTSIHPSTDLWP